MQKTQNSLITSLFLCFTLFSSCSEDEYTDFFDSNTSEINSSRATENIGIRSDIEEITKSESEIVTKFFLLNQTKSRTTKNIEISSTVTIRDSEGKPALYVNNLNDGYVIVSAITKSEPIQAYVETGHFNQIDSLNPMSAAISEMVKEKEFARKRPQNEDILKKWAKYQKIEIKSTKSRALSDDLLIAQDNFMEYLRNYSYDVYFLNDPPEDMPQEIYDRFIETSKGDDYWENSEDDAILSGIIAIRHEFWQYGRKLCNTIWGQAHLYNYYTPNRYKLGCATVAIGQFMKYHKFPYQFNWAKMPDDLTRENFYNYTELPVFLNEIREALNVNESGNSNSLMTPRVLQDYGYQLDISDYLNYTDTPVLTSGIGPNETVGHTWIIDGETTHLEQTEYILYLPHKKYYPDIKYVEADAERSSPWTTNYYHMNWGWYGKDNGWYLNYNLSELEREDQSFNYTERRSYIKAIF